MTEIYGTLPAGITRAKKFKEATYERQAVSLIDLIRARLVNGAGVIRDVTFKSCRIEGPAVMLVLGCNFNACDFGNPGDDIRNLILRPASPTGVIGAIPVDACSFTDCAFVGVGYTGASQFLDQIIALGNPK